METRSTGGRVAETLPPEFQSVLKDMKYPIKRNDIVDQARKSGVTPEILVDLGMLPDKEYKSADEVKKAYEERVSKAAEQK